MELKNLKKTSQRIIKAVSNKERIILYGDADLDGLASVVILKESIENLGGEVNTVYFPDRRKEGYGLNNSALAWLKKKAPALLILLDCGISNFEEIARAKKLGFKTVIIDHHEVLDKMPKAAIIVDPKQNGDRYPFKALATGGIIFRLSKLLFKKKFSKELENSFLELVALATLADMMPKVGENKVFIEKGLALIKETSRPGLKVLKRAISKNSSVLRGDIYQRIVSVLNFSGVKNHLLESYRLLAAKEKKTAEKIAKKIIKEHQRRQLKIKKILAEAEVRVLKNPAREIIFEGDSRWEAILLGSVASKICSKYHQPTFIFKKGKNDSRGAVRVPKGLNGVAAMSACARYLTAFGGHPLAAGFRVKNKNLGQFKTCLTRYFKRMPAGKG